MDAGVDDFMTKPFDREELAARLRAAERVLGLRRHVQVLEGLLPICAYCKRIRDDNNAWHSVEGYMSSHSEVKFSHGICPECFERIAPPLEAE